MRIISTSGDRLEHSYFIAGADGIGGLGVELVHRDMQAACHIAQIRVALQQCVRPLLDGAFLRPFPVFLALACAFGHLGEVQDAQC
jgi:hypothetical protein